jgi:hypothetical protein
MQQKKIVFLDIDGVLNTPKDAVERFDKWKKGEGKSRDEFGQLFCPIAVLHLEYLCYITGADVVVSSTWRKAGLARIKEMFAFRNIYINVIDVTPQFRDLPRGEEIADWLRNNEVNKYVIFDDDTDMLPEQMPYFVCTDFEDGLNWQRMVKGLKILMEKI